MDPTQEKVIMLMRSIEAACYKYGLSITVYQGKVAFVDEKARKIVHVWEPEHCVPPGQMVM